jgi:hypothetical protein
MFWCIAGALTASLAFQLIQEFTRGRRFNGQSGVPDLSAPHNVHH